MYLPGENAAVYPKEITEPFPVWKNGVMIGFPSYSMFSLENVKGLKKVVGLRCFIASSITNCS